MKTIVLGLFDELDDARQVLGELAGSPLDLDAIELVHENVETQHTLASEINLPPRRIVSAGLWLGAITGGVAGYFGGTTILTLLGPLLCTAAGAMLGAVAGSALGAISETTRVPPVHRKEMEAALAEGATAVIVRTDNLPTARAIGDLFQMGGSRSLSSLDEGEGDGSTSEAPVDQTRFAPPGDESETATGTISTPEPNIISAPSSATSAPSTVTGFEAPAVSEPSADASTAAPGTGETLFAPPWRRGGGGQPAVPPPTEAGIAQEPADPIVVTPEETTGTPTTDAPDASEAETTMEAKSASPEPVSADMDIAPEDADPIAAETEPTTPASAPPSLTPDTPVDELGLSTRVAGSLKKAGIANLAQLRSQAEGGEAALAALPGIGPVAVSLVLARLKQLGEPVTASPTVASPATSPAASTSAAQPPQARKPRPRAPRPQRVNARDLLLGAVREALDENEDGGGTKR